MHQIRGMNSVEQNTMDRMEEGRQMKGKKNERKKKKVKLQSTFEQP